MENQFQDLIHKYSEVFDNVNPLKQTNAIQHDIKLKSNKIVSLRQYKVSEKKQELIKSQISDMLENNIIEESTSPYSSPVLMVDREGKEPRFCVDFQKLNMITEDEECQPLDIKELISRLGDNTIFSTMDLLRGYWQIPLSEESKKYTAFMSPDNNKFQFKVLPFGLKTAPGTFMRMMRKVLAGLLGTICEVFLDDIIVYSPDYATHLHHLELVLERLNTYNLTASWKKCNFGKKEINFLGHIVSQETKAQEPHIKAIQECVPPKNKKQLQSIIGMLNWLRDYVPRAAEIMAPLTSVLSRKPFSWTKEDTKNLDKVKEAFRELESLHRPNKNLPLILQTDASGIGLAATLYQEDDNGKKFIISNASIL